MLGYSGAWQALRVPLQLGGAGGGMPSAGARPPPLLGLPLTPAILTPRGRLRERLWVAAVAVSSAPGARASEHAVDMWKVLRKIISCRR